MVKRIWKRFASLLLSAVMLFSMFTAFPISAYAAVSRCQVRTKSCCFLPTISGIRKLYLLRPRNSTVSPARLLEQARFECRHPDTLSPALPPRS